MNNTLVTSAAGSLGNELGLLVGQNGKYAIMAIATVCLYNLSVQAMDHGYALDFKSEALGIEFHLGKSALA